MVKPRFKPTIHLPRGRLVAFAAAIFMAIAGMLHAVPARAASGCVAPYPIEQYGSRGDCVRDLQQLANHKLFWLEGTGCGTLQTDGVFGAATTAGIKCIQRAFGLSVDGSVGVQTWRKLCINHIKPGVPVQYGAPTVWAWYHAQCSTLFEQD